MRLSLHMIHGRAYGPVDSCTWHVPFYYSRAMRPEKTAAAWDPGIEKGLAHSNSAELAVACRTAMLNREMQANAIHTGPQVNESTSRRIVGAL